MRNLAPQERLDHDTSLRGPARTAAALTLALTLVSAAWTAPAAAQGAVPCTAIDDDAQRLACYDRALRGTPATPPAPERGAPARAAPAASAPAAAEAGSDERRSERRARESAAPAAPAAAPASRDADEEPVSIVIVGTRTLPGRETTFTAEDGTTWVQTDSQRVVGLPEPPFDAELRRGAMGSYFLVPADRARAIRVRERDR